MFYADTELGPRQSLLPSGTLWARDVVIARVRDQIYHRSELWGIDNIDRVTDNRGMRDASEVFDPQSMSSFEGAPITMGHPDDLVDSNTWKHPARRWTTHTWPLRRGR
jgi:hypothetical protein